MAARNCKDVIDDLRRSLSAVEAPQQLADTLAEQLSDSFGKAIIHVVLSMSSDRIEAWHGIPPNVTAQHSLRVDGDQARLGALAVPFPVFVSDPRRARLDPELARYIDRIGARSYAAVALYRSGRLSGWIECWYQLEHRTWTREDSALLQQCADVAGLALEGRIAPELPAAESPNPQLVAEIDDLKARYERIIAYGNLIMVRTNPEFELVDVRGDTMSVLGVSAETLLNDRTVWSRFVHSPDFRALNRKVRRMRDRPEELNEEIRVLNQQSQQVRWLLLRSVPLFNAGGEFLGWEGFGLDITDRREAREELLGQSKRVEALYEVARALQVNLDPALVTLRGLRALITATSSDCGFTCFYDPEQKALELVSSEGLSPHYVEDFSRLLGGPTLVRLAVDRKEGLLSNNIQRDPRAAVDIARREGLKSTIIMPLMLKDEVQGAIVLFCRKANRYSEADFDLVSAAASQICLAVRQAESYLAEKRQVSALGVLYRLSHELSKQMTPREIAEHAFPIIQSELSCKRMWLGVLNEQGTLLLGQAGTGPGVRRPLIDLQIEIGEQNDFLSQALSRKQPVIVRPAQQQECERLQRLTQRLNLGMFVIVPLVSLGQTVGILLVEPTLPSGFMIQRKLSLLSSMGAEIATVILARRFESKLADAEKMRMAGLLASGVAHNFNNMLQAVMGQASLIEMQLGKDSPLVGSARMIIEAAGKGAGLIKQLLSFALPGAESRTVISPQELFAESGELYRSILGSSIVLDVRIDDGLPEVHADYSKMQQVITNLLMNAKEAIGDRRDGLVKLTARAVRLASGEVDPELAPGSYLRIDVSDNGAGMDAERQSRCFEPFFTTKNVDVRTGLGFEGSGLGLSSAYSIIKGHEGSITVSSTLGEGTNFSIYLPAYQASATKDAEVPAATAAGGILARQAFVFGDALQRNFALISTLESFGIRVVPCSSSESFFQQAARDSWTMLVLEDQFGAESSAPLVHEVRAKFPDVRVLVITTKPQDAAAAFSDLQEVAIVGEPVSLWSVQAAIKRLVHGKQAGSGLVRSVQVEGRGSDARKELAPVRDPSRNRETL